MPNKLDSLVAFPILKEAVKATNFIMTEIITCGLRGYFIC